MVDFREMLYSIDPNSMLLGLLFIIFYVFVQYALSRSIRNKKSSAIIAFCVSLLAVYGINRMSWDISGFFYGLGLSENFLYTIVPLIILAGLIFMIWKLKLSRTLMITGILLIIASFLVYEKGIILIIGIVLFLIGLLLSFRKKKFSMQTRNTGLTNQAIQKERGIIENQKEQDRRLINQQRALQAQQERKAIQTANEIKQLSWDVDRELKLLVEEYNRVQKENPNNSSYLIKIRERILYLKKEKKRLQG